MTTADEVARRIVEALDGRGDMARCPCHEDRTPSLHVTVRDGKVLVRDFGGCAQGVVIDELRARGLWIEHPKTEKPGPLWSWEWAAPDGKVRTQHHWPTGKKWSKAGPGKPKPPDLLYKPPGCELPAYSEPLLIVEGAKTADAVWLRLKLPAVAIPSASTSPTDESLKRLTGRLIWLSPDNDTLGVTAMQRLGYRFRNNHGCTVAWVDPAAIGLGPKQDLADWRDPDIAQLKAAVRPFEPPAEAAAPAREPTTSEHHLAELFVLEHGHEWRCQVERDRWMRWQPDEGWTVDSAGAVVELAGAFGRERMQRVNREGECVADTVRGGKIATARAVVAYGRAMKPVPTSSADWDAVRDLVGLPGCRILETENTPRGGCVVVERARSPDDLVSRSLAAMPSDPEAWQGSVWADHLMTLFDDPMVAVLLQRLMGYALLGRGTEDKVIVSPGNRGCGKTVTYGAIMRAAGGYGASIDPGAIISHRVGQIHPVGRMAFAGTRIAVTAELATGAVLDAEWVKRLSGGEVCVARGMREAETRFVYGGILAIHTNHAPELLTPDDGLKRRLLVIPFRRPREHEDPDFDQRIQLEDVVGWMLAGMRDYLAEGFGAVPPTVLEETAQYHVQADVLSEFVGDELAIQQGERAAAADIYQRYETWCRDRGMKRPMTARTLNTRLAEGGFGVDKARVGGTTWLTGCVLA